MTYYSDKILFWAGIFLFFLSCAKINLSPPSSANLPCRLDSILDRAGETVSWSIEIRDLSDGNIIYLHDPNRRLIPASNAKLFTTAAALHLFGADYQFNTSILAASLPDSNGCLKGNVYIKSSCDPSISQRFLFESDPFSVVYQCILDLKDIGLDTIRGNIVLQDKNSNEPNLHPTWEWSDLAYPYAAPCSPFSLNDNCLDVQFFWDVLPDTYYACLYPPPHNFQLISKVTINDSATDIANFWLNDSTLEISGTIERDKIVKKTITVPNPKLFFRNCLLSALFQAKIVLLPDPSSTEPSPLDSLIVLSEHISPPLADIVKVVNTHSVNHMADQLLLAMGETQGEFSFSAGLSARNNFIQQAGLDTESIHLVDGSGLSRHNWIAANDLIELLSYCYYSTFFQPFLNSLARYGEGTFYLRTPDSDSDNFYHQLNQNIYVKTGSMTGVKSFSGYLLTTHQQITFAFICNNFSCPATQIDQIIDDALRIIVCK